MPAIKNYSDMPSVPPFSRSEKLSDYAKACFPIVWKEEIISSADNKKLALCIGENGALQDVQTARDHVVVLYFQGYVTRCQ